MIPDYFTQTYVGVWTALNRRLVTIDGLILPGNFPNMADPNFTTFKNLVKPSDTPELIMVQGAFKLAPYGSNSSIAEFTQAFPIVVTCQDLTTVQVNPIKMSIMVASFQAGTPLGGGATEDNFGLPFVQSFRIDECKDDALSDSLFKRGSLRYISLLTITLSGYLDRAELAAA